MHVAVEQLEAAAGTSWRQRLCDLCDAYPWSVCGQRSYGYCSHTCNRSYLLACHFSSGCRHVGLWERHALQSPLTDRYCAGFLSFWMGLSGVRVGARWHDRGAQQTCWNYSDSSRRAGSAILPLDFKAGGHIGLQHHCACKRVYGGMQCACFYLGFSLDERCFSACTELPPFT